MYFARDDAQDFLLGEARPKTLIDDTAAFQPIFFFGAFPKKEPGVDKTTSFRRLRSSPSPSQDVYLVSSTPLEKAVRLQVFHASNDTEGNVCRRILLGYENEHNELPGNVGMMSTRQKRIRSRHSSTSSRWQTPLGLEKASVATQ